MTTALDEAYEDGMDAAYRHGRYAGATRVPPCPYPDGSAAYKRWWDGFGDGTEDLIAAQRAN